jgi:hypothetical protein
VYVHKMDAVLGTEKYNRPPALKNNQCARMANYNCQNPS